MTENHPFHPKPVPRRPDALAEAATIAGVKNCSPCAMIDKHPKGDPQLVVTPAELK